MHLRRCQGRLGIVAEVPGAGRGRQSDDKGRLASALTTDEWQARATAWSSQNYSMPAALKAVFAAGVASARKTVRAPSGEVAPLIGAAS